MLYTQSGQSRVYRVTQLRTDSINGGWAEVHGRVEARRGRRGQTSPGEERGNETGKVAIAHGRVEFCEATPTGLADESQESLYGHETDRDHLRNADLRSAWTYMWMRRMIFFIYLFSPNKQRARGGGGAARFFFFFFFPLFSRPRAGLATV